MIQIHRDVRAGNVDAVTQLLTQGVDIDVRNPEDNRTPLIVAVTSDQAGVDMMRLLIEHGADVNAVKEKAYEEIAYEEHANYTVLAFAVQQGTLDTVKLLIEAGADVDYQREGGYNVLIDAMHSRAMTEKEPLLPLIELLLEHGASTQGESDWGESALSVSSHIGRFDVVARLLDPAPMRSSCTGLS
jgi:ankyrin repeat protein